MKKGGLCLIVQHCVKQSLLVRVQIQKRIVGATGPQDGRFTTDQVSID